VKGRGASPGQGKSNEAKAGCSALGHARREEKRVKHLVLKPQRDQFRRLLAKVTLLETVSTLPADSRLC